MLIGIFGEVLNVCCRCFCELAHQIGFSDDAVDIFELEQVLGLYEYIVSFTLTTLFYNMK